MDYSQEILEAKEAIDHVIDIGRIHLYKPIQIAEILYHSRIRGNITAENLEEYRTESRHWRDKVSRRLVGNVSTSSARYQDNLFDDNAVPPEKISTLDDENKKHNGIVENYIYQRLVNKWGGLVKLDEFLKPPFDFKRFMERFKTETALVRSVDKAYEISTFVLFKTLTLALDLIISVRINNPDQEILNDFSDFLYKVLGIPENSKETTFVSEIYRLGVANAADTGIDVLSNFGATIQVKHVTLNPDLAASIIEPISARKIIIVCLEPERTTISSIISQIGANDRIQSIITDKDLGSWYRLVMDKYYESIGKDLLYELEQEFIREFPQISNIQAFMKERGYKKENLLGIWKI